MAEAIYVDSPLARARSHFDDIVDSAMEAKRKYFEPEPVEPKSVERPYRMLPDGGYEYLHPTKGWKRVSRRRYDAQTRMAHLLGGA